MLSNIHCPVPNSLSKPMIFISQNQWSTVFSGIVSRAMTLEVLSTGVAGNYNGAFQVVIILYNLNIFP